MSVQLVLVGRPNVGKSTLFNQLTRSRQALVADRPGLTRDRQFGTARLGKLPCTVVDTGGLGEESAHFADMISEQVDQALELADAVLFLVDARAGLTPDDHAIAQRLRKTGLPVWLLVNKSDGKAVGRDDFYALGFSETLPIAATHRHGLSELAESLEAAFPHRIPSEEPSEDRNRILRIAVSGRPNAGKSTLINRLLGEDRLLASEEAGTTRDSVEVPFELEGSPCVLVDTAGIRRRSKTRDHIEKISVIKAMQAVSRANVVVHLIDAQRELSDQDLRLIGHVVDQGRALILGVNKWDKLPGVQQDSIRQQLLRKQAFLGDYPLLFISALEGSGLQRLKRTITRVYQNSRTHWSTHVLTEHLQKAMERHQPPLAQGRYRSKLRYAHQGGQNPPTIIMHGNRLQHLPASYLRYLGRSLREAYDLEGTPVLLHVKHKDNPYQS